MLEKKGFDLNPVFESLAQNIDIYECEIPRFNNWIIDIYETVYLGYFTATSFECKQMKK